MRKCHRTVKNQKNTKFLYILGVLVIGAMSR